MILILDQLAEAGYKGQYKQVSLSLNYIIYINYLRLISCQLSECKYSSICPL